MGGLLQTLKSLGPTRLMAISGVGVLLLVFFAFLIMRVSAPNMELLYRDLDPGDASQIVNRLEDQQVQYQLLNNGTEILVPADQVNRMRLSMAESGLPTGGSVGYEVFDNSDGFGATSLSRTLTTSAPLKANWPERLPRSSRSSRHVFIWFCPNAKCSRAKRRTPVPRLP